MARFLQYMQYLVRPVVQSVARRVPCCRPNGVSALLMAACFAMLLGCDEIEEEKP